MKGGNGVSAANEVTLRQAPEKCSPDGESVITPDRVGSRMDVGSAEISFFRDITLSTCPCGFAPLFAPLPPFNHN